MSGISRRSLLRLTAAAGVGAATAAGCSSAGEPRKAAPRRQPTPQQQERAQLGARDWKLHRTGSTHEIEGYAVPAAGQPGQRVELFVTSTRKSMRVEAFRIGWYAGLGARRVWSRDDVRVGDQIRHLQVTGATRTVQTSWQPAVQVDTTGWPEGAYLFRLTADGGAQRYVPYIVTSPEASGRVLLVHSLATWQAYNPWGGYSLYHGPGGLGDYGNRSYVVSLDRPFAANGAGQFGVYERSVVQLIERLGLPVAHTTSMELDADPRLATAAKAVITLGHDEYWTQSMRDHVTQARDRGVNVAFLGANACFRRIRLDRSALGSARRVVCYKTDYTKDPMYGRDNAIVTNDWREPPDPRPESTLTGTLYEAYPANAAYVVAEPSAWVFAGTGVKAGDRFGDLVGPEYDRVNPDAPLQRPMTVLSHSKLICKGVNSFSDSAYYNHPSSGAGVINVGTMRWVEAMTGANGHCDRRTARFVTRVTANILRGFARGPAAERHPAKDNVERFHPWPGDPTYTHHDLW